MSDGNAFRDPRPWAERAACCGHREPVFDVRNLQVRYGGRPALRGVSMQVHRGCITAVIGPSGCGKSTWTGARRRCARCAARSPRCSRRRRGAATGSRRGRTGSSTANWKVYVDNYLEGYHLPCVHPGLSRVLDYRVYATELYPWRSLQHSPLRANDGIYGDGEAFYYFVYPNVMLNVMPGRLQTNRVLPLGPERCRVEFDYYYAPEAEARARIDRDREFSDEIQREDVAICEAVQRGLASGRYDAGRLSPKRESGLWHFHTLLRQAYAVPD